MTQNDLFQTATSSQPDTHASHLVRPGSDEARKMTVTSGRKYLPLCKQSGRLGAFSRMFLDTSAWASTKCYLTWKAKATPSNRLLFQLAPSMPRTDETESGLWPTATTQDNPQVRGQGKTIGTNRGTTLGGAVRMWATPTAAIAQGTAKPPTKGGGSRDLRQDVKMWPTPIATDGSKCPTGSLAKLVEAGNKYMNKNGTPIAHKKHMFSTPTASDAKGAPANRYLGSEKSHGNLSEQVRTSPTSGQLNPQWVEWLMGYPEGWTDLKG